MTSVCRQKCNDGIVFGACKACAGNPPRYLYTTLFTSRFKVDGALPFCLVPSADALNHQQRPNVCAVQWKGLDQVLVCDVYIQERQPGQDDHETCKVRYTNRETSVAQITTDGQHQRFLGPQ